MLILSIIYRLQSPLKKHQPAQNVEYVGIVQEVQAKQGPLTRCY